MINSFEQQAAVGGVVTVTGTTAITGNFCAIQVLTNATFSVFTENKATGDAMTGIVIPALTILRGHITSFTLTSGAVRAHRLV